MDIMKFVSVPYYGSLFARDTNYSDFNVIAHTLGVINIPTLKPLNLLIAIVLLILMLLTIA